MINFLTIDKSKISQIRYLALNIFPETYKNLLSPEQISYMLDMMYSEQSLEIQFNNGAEFYLVFYKDNAVGYGSITILGNSAELHKIYLSHTMQGKGLGRSFLRFLEKESFKKGATKIQLFVNRDNPAKFFYEKLGYKIEREVDKAIGDGYFMNDYLMVKAL